MGNDKNGRIHYGRYLGLKINKNTRKYEQRTNQEIKCNIEDYDIVTILKSKNLSGAVHM